MTLAERFERRRQNNRQRSAKYRALHRDRVLASLKTYRSTHLEQERQRNKAYQVAHRKPTSRKRLTSEEKRMYCRAYHAAHREEIHARKRVDRLANLERFRANYKVWARANPSVCAAMSAKRRAAIMMAMPIWADSQAIKRVYREAARLTRETGVQHDVDHFYPLQSPFVCGLHVATNLQILTHEENIRKNNKLPVEMAA